MKRILSIALICCTLLLLVACGQPKADKPYDLGEKMEDFTITLDDGSTCSLYSLLKEKKAVLINFWASWCEPCKEEFPYIEEALKELQNDIAIIALSASPSDTPEEVTKMKEECRLTNLPFGLDPDLYKSFGFTSVPASVVVDRNGIICYAKTGSLPTKDHFVRLLTPYTEADYSAPLLLEAVPGIVAPVAEPGEAELKAALGISDEHLRIVPNTDNTVWPFVPDDKGGVVATNTQIMDTVSKVTIHVEAGAGAGLSFKNNGMYAFLRNGLLDVSVDGERKLSVPGSEEWSTNYVILGDENVAHDVTFTYESNNDYDEPIRLAIKDISLLNTEELDARVRAEKKPTNLLRGKTAPIQLISGVVKPITFTSTDGTSGEDISYRTMDSDLTFRISVGDGIDARIAFVVTRTYAVPLYTLPCDEDGYLIQWTNPGPGFECDTIDVYASIDDAFSVGMMELYDSEAALDKWIWYANDRYPEAQMDWAYADGSPRETVRADAPGAPSTDKSTYCIHVTDEDGAPLEGVFIKFCDDDSCQALFTDENGLAAQTAPPKPYEVHVLTVPDGYAADETSYTMPKEGGDLDIVLKKHS